MDVLAVFIVSMEGTEAKSESISESVPTSSHCSTAATTRGGGRISVDRSFSFLDFAGGRTDSPMETSS